MKFKYPKKIMIGSTEFIIKYDANRGGAEFCYPDGKNKGFIIIGTREIKSNPLVFLENVMHELKEILHEEQGTRFNNRLNASYEFHYNHAHHTGLCARLSALLDKFIK